MACMSRYDTLIYNCGKRAGEGVGGGSGVGWVGLDGLVCGRMGSLVRAGIVLVQCVL